jgi:hypothetical protein
MNLLKKQVKVKPNARKQAIAEAADGSLTVQLKSPPVDGKANHELIEILAEHYQVSRSSVTILSGHRARLKRVAIDLPSQGT